MADYSESKHTKQQRELNEAKKVLAIAKQQEQEKIKNGMRSVVGPNRSIILKKK